MGRDEQCLDVVIDTSLLLHLFLDQEPSYAERVLHLFKSPKYRVHLPTLVGVECINTTNMRGSQQRAPISTPEIDKAREFLDSAPIVWIELDEWAMRLAQELGPKLVLKPQDSAILACAIRGGCQYLYTNDKALRENSAGLEEITVCELPPLPAKQLTLEVD